MVNPLHRLSPFATIGDVQKLIEDSKVRGWLFDGKICWGLASSTLIDEHPSCREAVRPVRIIVKNGEAWVVDSQGRNEFKVVVNPSPIARERASEQFGNTMFRDFRSEATGNPDTVAVLTGTDNSNGRTGVVVMLRGWLYTEPLVSVPGPQGDLADGDQDSFLRLYGA